MSALVLKIAMTRLLPCPIAEEAVLGSRLLKLIADNCPTIVTVPEREAYTPGEEPIYRFKRISESVYLVIHVFLCR